MMILPALALSLASLGSIVMGTGDCVVVAPLDGAEWVVEGSKGECGRRTLPASTFKIPHALIALQTQTVTDQTVIKWDGTKRDYSVWNRDQTLQSAIQMSAVWVFQQFATSIGRERELEHLRAFRYGSASFKYGVSDFWLNGDLQISPLEQVAFLRRMFSYDLPVERRHIDTVKADLTMPRGKFVNATGVHDFTLPWSAETVVRVKSGNGSVKGERVSWLVGALEAGGRQYIFASRVRNFSETLESAAGAQLALAVLGLDNPGAPHPSQVAPARTHGLVELWAQGKAAFGVYAPNENPGPRGERGQPPQPAVYTRAGGEKLAINPLYDYVFLNLEGTYDAAAVKAMADGLRSPTAVSRKALIVRIPPIDKDGAAAAKARVKRVKEGFLALLMQGPAADEAITIGRAAAGR